MYGIWDYRTEPEGIIFSDTVIDQDKISRVEAERIKHEDIRKKIFQIDSDIQPAKLINDQ